jgi:hypothetical protein
MVIPKPQKKSAAKVVPKFSLDQYKVDLEAEVTQEVVFRIQDRIALTKGSLMVLTGKPKARKSTFLHTFIASCLKQDRIWGVSCELPPDQSIVLVDTEQSLFDLHRSLGLLSYTISTRLADHPRFAVYSARSLDVEAIKDLILKILDHHSNCGVLALDGILDLVNDINDVRESKEAIRFIKKLCDDRNIAMIGIIHQNKATNFSMGHLGAFASRFCQSELAVLKNDDGTSTMSATYMRSADDFDPIQIGWDPLHSRYDVSRNIVQSAEVVPPDYINRDTVKRVFDGRSAVMYRDLISLTRIVFPELTKYAVEKKIIPAWYAENLITKRGNLIQLTMQI